VDIEKVMDPVEMIIAAVTAPVLEVPVSQCQEAEATAVILLLVVLVHLQLQRLHQLRLLPQKRAERHVLIQSNAELAVLFVYIE
jgi:hypothetical protein